MFADSRRQLHGFYRTRRGRAVGALFSRSGAARRILLVLVTVAITRRSIVVIIIITGMLIRRPDEDNDRHQKLANIADAIHFSPT